MKEMLKYLGAVNAKVGQPVAGEKDRYEMFEAGMADLILLNGGPLVSKVRAVGKYHVIEPRERIKAEVLTK